MNREVIKRYKKEFEWWLNGGSIKFESPYNGEWVYSDTPSFSEGVKYVINDEYIEFRIAEAEGKTIQFNLAGKWVDHFGRCEFSFQVKDYRVKPETVTKWQWSYKNKFGYFELTIGFYQSKEDTEVEVLGAIEPYLPSAREFKV